MKTVRFLEIILSVVFLTHCASKHKTKGILDNEDFDSFDITKAISQAHGNADHKLIAAYYRKEFATYLTMAGKYRNLAEWYWSAYDDSPATHARSADLVKAANYCANLGRLNTHIAEHYLSLAQEHQKVAETR
jgi:hypothetical protein